MSAPVSGIQLYQQRLLALRAGEIFTRLPSDRFESEWRSAKYTPTYSDWKNLLAQEAVAVSKMQNSSRLAILLGDSLSLWFPSEKLPGGRFWLNQSISGDTVGGIVQRLSTFALTKPSAIYIMAGINELKNGMGEDTIINQYRQLLRRLQQTHPKAQRVIQSVLPTNLPSHLLSFSIPNPRIRYLNNQLAVLAETENAYYLDIYYRFADAQGNLWRELTTDGLHLNLNGYQVWQFALYQVETRLSLNRDKRYQLWLMNSSKFTVEGKQYDWVPYKTRPGDSLAEIALSTLGSAEFYYWDLIAIKNRLNSNALPPNITLYIPRLLKETSE